jgi:hypothetical protein
MARIASALTANPGEGKTVKEFLREELKIRGSMQVEPPFLKRARRLLSPFIATEKFR